MRDVDGRCRIVFNGEIYNFVDLRRDLEAAGARFATRSDTEVVLEAYKRWDTDCLSRLNGMFAFALWDEPRQRLLLARDRAGEKPLFYQPLAGGGVIFASDLNAMRRHPAVGSRVDAGALSDFLSLGYVQSPHSLIAGVNRLEPAQAAIAERGKPLRFWRYWNLADAFASKRRFRSEDEAADALRSVVDDAVRIRLVSDVPLGAFLSGGIDSSTIVASMNHARPADQNFTFSVGFAETTYDELPEARAVAAALGVRHADRIVEPDMSVELPRVTEFLDEPLADTSAIPTYFLAAFARQHVTVCLSGDGGDECFAGYETYTADKLRRRTAWVPRSMVRALARAADAVLPITHAKVGTAEKIRRFLAGQPLDWRCAHYTWRLIAGENEKRRLLRPEAGAAISGHDPFHAVASRFDEVPEAHYLDQAAYVDIKTWLADDLLVKIDRMTMAHSLEARAPFLDHRVMEFAASLPVDLKLKGWRKKHILKRSQRGRLPARTLARTKQGFNAPVSRWMNGPLRDVGRDAFRSGALWEWFDADRVDALWREHERGDADHGLLLFELTCLGLWRTRVPVTL